MSWINDNMFGVALGGITAVVAGGLVYWGLDGSSRVSAASDRFQAAADEVTSLQRAPLSPSAANRDGKRKALGEYRVSVDALQQKFLAFRPKEIVDIPPSDFGTRLLEITGKGRKSLETAGVKVPPNALGLEQYTSKPAEQGATGILSYQVSAIAALAEMLAEARPSAIVNIHRPPLVEETRGKYAPAEDEVARALPVELTLRGQEKSIRSFLDKVVNDKTHFFVVRSLRVLNEKRRGPTADEAKFEAPKPAAGFDNPFTPSADGGFVLPPEPADETKPAGKAVKPAPAPAAVPAKPAADPAAPAADPAAPAADPTKPAADAALPEEAPPTAPVATPPPKPRAGRQVLKQLVGNEEITVWMRIDLLLFHEGVALPGEEKKH